MSDFNTICDDFFPKSNRVVSNKWCEIISGVKSSVTQTNGKIQDRPKQATFKDFSIFKWAKAE